jgi:hypothetical protein
MKTLIQTLVQKLKSKTQKKQPVYGSSIFAQDDTIHLTRRVIEAQRKQLLKLI